MSVTVVLPTVGDTPKLRSSVENMLRTTARAGPDSEVLVVVNGRSSVPALDHIGSTRLRVLHLDQRNGSKARNVGIEAARHDTVLFGDDGAAVVTDWCPEMAGALNDPEYPVITAPTRVPVTGPVTAFLNHQRLFDAPPIDAIEARTVTGHCGLRRDRLPANVRYNEDDLPWVGEDVAFGHAVRAAGLRIKWFAGGSPGLHLLSDHPDEILERAFRYGRGVSIVWRRGAGTGGSAAPPPVASPAEVLGLYRFRVESDHRYRRFPEIADPGVRAAFTVYDYLYDVAFLLGYVVELGDALDHEFVDLDHDGLRAAWQDIAARAAAGTAHLSQDEWTTLPLDYNRLDTSTAAVDPLIAEIRRSLATYAAPRYLTAPPDPDAPQAPSTVDEYRGPARAPTLPRLHEAWWALRTAGAPFDADAVDGAVRAAGFGFRFGCGAIELAAQRLAARGATGAEMVGIPGRKSRP